MPLVDTGLVVRYYLDEAASGTAPTAVEDVSGNNYDLTLNYGAGATDLEYIEVSGNRGLDFKDTAGDQRADKVITDAGDALRTALNSTTKQTMEVVCSLTSFSASGGRVFAINAGTDLPRIGFIGTGGTTWQFAWGQTVRRTWDGAEDTRLVLHFVVDTTQATANDRIKIYSNGSLVSPTINTNPALNATFSIPAQSNDPRLFMGNRGTSSYGRSFDGVLYYAALYAHAFSSTDVTTNYDILTTDDDTPAVGGSSILRQMLMHH